MVHILYHCWICISLWKHHFLTDLGMFKWKNPKTKQNKKKKQNTFVLTVTLFISFFSVNVLFSQRMKAARLWNYSLWKLSIHDVWEKNTTHGEITYTEIVWNSPIKLALEFYKAVTVPTLLCPSFLSCLTNPSDIFEPKGQSAVNFGRHAKNNVFLLFNVGCWI